MRCANCGAEVGDSQGCSNCQQRETDIKVLSPEENRDFHGITIDQSGNASEENYERPREKVYIRHASFSLTNTSFLVKLLIGVGLAVLAIGALSAVSFFALIGCLVWFVLRLFR